MSAKACKIEFNGNHFTSEEEFNDAVLKYHQNKRAEFETEQDYVVHILENMGQHFTFTEADHKYVHNESGEEFKSTTTKIGEYFGDENITQSPVGEYSRFVGNNYHEICEAILQGRREGKSIEESLDKRFNFTWDNGETESYYLKDLVEHPVYSQIAEWINGKYDEWTEDGSVVLSEFVLGNTATKTAGTVDVAVVHKDGSVTIYDFKGTKDKYGEHIEKLRHNNFQLNVYRAMNEVGDPNLDLPGLKVNSANIIPIVHDIQENEDKTFSVQSAEINDPISIDNEEVYKDNAKYKSIAQSMFSPEVLNTSLKVLDKIDFGGEVNNLTGHSSMGDNLDIEKIAKRKMHYVIKGKDGVYRYRYLGKEVPFSNRDAARNDGPDGEDARLKELVDEVVPKQISSNTNFAKSVIDAFYHGLDTTDKEWDEKKNKIISNLLSRYTKGSDHLVLAKTVPGLENVDGNTVIVYKNFNQITGEYTSIDLLNIDSNNNDLLETPADGSESKNIFGNRMGDGEFKMYAQRAKVAGGTVYNNNKKHNDVLKMGLIAMALKKNNPNLKIGDVRAVSVNSRERDVDNVHSFSGSMRTILEHLKIIAESKNSKKGSDLYSKMSPEVQEMLEDTNLMREQYYQQDEAENYLIHMIEILNMDIDKRDDLSAGKKEALSETQAQLRRWRYAQMGELLGKHPDRNTVKALVEQVKSDHETKRELIAALGQRLNQLKALSDDSTSSSFATNSEVEMIAKSIAQLNGITTTIDSIKDISHLERFTSSSGFTGNELIDSFSDKVNEVHNTLEQKLVNGYMKDKMKKFKEFFGKNIGEGLVGTHTRHFENLLEQNTWTVNGKQITRKTGKFKSLDDPTLSNKDKEFIEWFNTTIKEYYAKMGKDWPDYYVPMVKASTSNIAYKAASRTLKGEKGGFKNTFKTILKRKKEAHDTIKDEYYDADYNTKLDTISTMFESQGLDPEKTPNMEKFDTHRNNHLGLNELGEPKDGVTPDDMMETNLERVLDMLVITTEAKEAFEPLLPVYDSVKLMIASAKHQTMQKLGNIDEYLRVYTEAALHNKRQQLFKDSGIEAVISGASGFTSAIAIGWNIRSGLKNFLAGYLHNNANHMAKLFAGEKGTYKNYAKAIKASYELVYSNKPRESNKVHMIMDLMALHDADVENLKNDKRFKAGGNNLFSSRSAHWMNYAGDYMHRATMAISKLIADGSWEAFELKTDSNGEQYYQYNEDLDPRFKGKEGEALKRAVKLSLAETGGLDEDGRMKVPWATQEILKVQKEAAITYQTQGLADHATYKQYAIGRAGLQMMSWLASKRERYWKEGHRNKRLGQWVSYVDANGETQYEWQGVYVEGIAQTMKGMYAALANTVTGKEKGALKTFFNNMDEHQRKNLGYLTNDVVIASLLMAAVAAAFDDEDKDTWLYRLLMGTVSEIFVADYAEAAATGFTTPFPSVSIVMKQIEGILSMDPEKMAYSAGRMLGPVKLIEQGQMILNDIDHFSDK